MLHCCRQGGLLTLSERVKYTYVLGCIQHDGTVHQQSDLFVDPQQTLLAVCLFVLVAPLDAAVQQHRVYVLVELYLVQQQNYTRNRG